MCYFCARFLIRYEELKIIVSVIDLRKKKELNSHRQTELGILMMMREETHPLHDVVHSNGIKMYNHALQVYQFVRIFMLNISLQYGKQTTFICGA